MIIPLQQLKEVNPSSSRANSSEKYIQVISVDSHEFWYMGFLNYDGAVKCLQDAIQTRGRISVWWGENSRFKIQFSVLSCYDVNGLKKVLMGKEFWGMWLLWKTKYLWRCKNGAQVVYLDMGFFFVHVYTFLVQ